jgi:hypothetical protein
MAWVAAIPSNRVYPSGGAFAAMADPMVPDAPGWFSTITVCFMAAPMVSAIRRPMTSTEPPGANGTISLITRSG